MKILGHRGVPTVYPENTLVSLLEAVRLGADGVETDVRLTADGVPVLVHDEDLGRLCGVDGRVGDLTLSQLKTLRIHGEEIPTLEEFLLAMPSGRWLNIELKETAGADEVVKLATRLYDGELLFSSFHHETISQLKFRFPEVRFGYLFGEQHRNMTTLEILELFREKTFSAHVPIALKRLDPERFLELVNTIKRIGVQIVVWTVNDPSELEDIVGLVDFVITDNVEHFLKRRS